MTRRIDVYFLTSIFIFYFFLLSSCAKDVPEMPHKEYASNFNEVFETFWHGMNKNYVFWDIDTTNWNLAYNKYQKVFSELDLGNEDDVRQSIRYFKELTRGLVDSHYSIEFSHPAVKDSIVFPAYYRKSKASNFHSTYPYAVVDATYLDTLYISGYDSTSDRSKLKYALSGLIDNNILFFYCNEFSLFQSYHANELNGIKPVLKYFFSKIDNTSPDIKGIIIDVRGNQGGYINDLNFLVGRLIGEPLHFGWTRYRNGNGRKDYTPWIEAVVKPSRISKTISLPIVVITDNHTASLAETVTMALGVLPNCSIVGEPTWGATGQLAPNEIYNSGSFAVLDFMTVRMSAVEFRYVDAKIYEGIGFSPDIMIPFNRDLILTGTDLQLQKAIDLINE